MGKIVILDDSVSSKIAAGEVIERPVSVVKELVENSIDAGSKHINIEIEKGGKKLIKVSDDGEGISKDDVKPAFERHATSKIHKLDDIFNIKTLGFRGEALPSIACVSNIVVLTKTSEELTGTRCEIRGGTIEKFEEAPARNGCCIEVSNLFYNTPARLKFLGSEAQEIFHITDLITRLSIGNPHISFRLVSDGKEILYTSGNGDYNEAIARIYGKDVAKQIIQIQKSFSSGNIYGFISTPQYNRGNRTGETFFVNRRLIKDKGLSYALERAYKTLLPVSRFPIAIVMIDIDSSQIDVNVHPAKLEIKFQKENEVHKALFEAVLHSLKSNTLIPVEKFYRDSEEPDRTEKNNPQVLEQQTTLIIEEDKGSKINNLLKSVYSPSTHDIISKKPFVCEAAHNQYFENRVENQHVDTRGRFTVNKIIGQLFNTYIIAEGEREFYLIDQHAAHERILFEKYSNKFNQKPASQELIQPYALKISVQDMTFVEEYSQDIKNMGFDISIFGKDTVLIRSVPYFFDKVVKPETLGEVLDNFRGEEYIVLHPREKFIASMACHTAIKAGDVLNFVQMNDLINQLKDLENPFTCPHGRPTTISMTQYELDKKFKRIV
ncbi:MAG TPA: DNA mismatch repair endonuclease MutL [Thermoanaerobacterales bacterium]|nr:DNA mismatch repair endonuclease MutL [Thermoanaerobacterales bacterium]